MAAWRTASSGAQVEAEFGAEIVGQDCLDVSHLTDKVGSFGHYVHAVLWKVPPRA